MSRLARWPWEEEERLWMHSCPQTGSQASPIWSWDSGEMQTPRTVGWAQTGSAEPPDIRCGEFVLLVLQQEEPILSNHSTFQVFSFQFLSLPPSCSHSYFCVPLCFLCAFLRIYTPTYEIMPYVQFSIFIFYLNNIENPR